MIDYLLANSTFLIRINFGHIYFISRPIFKFFAGHIRTNEPCHEKPCFSICENKGADQLHGNRETDQRFCFRYMIIQYIYFLNPLLAIFCTVRFSSDLIEIPADRFSRDAVQNYISIMPRKVLQLLFVYANYCDFMAV